MTAPAPKVSSRGAVFDTAMKVLKEIGKAQGRMQTWYCPEDKAFHVLVGKVGCATCALYEVRVELDDPAAFELVKARVAEAVAAAQ